MFRFGILRRNYMAKGMSTITDKKIWNKMIFDILTKLEGADENTITSKHYEVLEYVRKYYLEKKRAPSIEKICSMNGLTVAEFLSLFPDWPHTLFNIDAIVCTIMGIPYWNIDC